MGGYSFDVVQIYLCERIVKNGTNWIRHLQTTAQNKL